LVELSTFDGHFDFPSVVSEAMDGDDDEPNYYFELLAVAAAQLVQRLMSDQNQPEHDKRHERRADEREKQEEDHQDAQEFRDEVESCGHFSSP
jgi:hypothetical protein